MDSRRWQKIQTLFHDAADRPRAEWRAYLESRCGADPTLVQEVLNLLEEDERGASLLEGEIGRIASEVLDDPDRGPAAFQKVGPYTIHKVLGEGGMGVVYLAAREDLGNLVAIKVLRDAWLSPARRERFAAEQRMLAQMNHPSIARIYDANATPDGSPFFVMEYVEGAPLTDYCNQRRIALAERLELFRRVCEAVQYAHQRAIIHRDLKPSNILVKDDGSVRLLDFGISKHLESFSPSAEQTRTGLRLMTPAYAAPEQMRGEPAGIQADVYSLGVTLYQLLTGRLPFDFSSCTPGQAERVVTEQEPEKPSAAVEKAVRARETPAVTAGKTAWADLDVLCLTAMHKDSTRRYQSVEALIRDIDHYLKAEPLEARPDTARYRLGKFVRRNRRPVTISAAATVAVVGLIAFFTVRLAIERNLAQRQTAIATAVNQFLSDDLLGRGNPFQSGKANETLLDAVKQASPSIDREFAHEPEVAARLHLTIAQALDNRSNFPEARQEYEHARQLLVRVGGALSQDAIAVQLQRAAMEARSFQSGGLPAAKSLIAQEESLIRKIQHPRKDLEVWLFTAKGMLALVESDAKGANRNFQAAVDAGANLPGFDEVARFNLKQRLAFTYIRLGDGATAERLARELIAAYSKLNGSDSAYVLRVRLNLAQALMIEKKFPESVHEANRIYPDFLAKFGPDHELTMQLLTTRAQSEGSMGDFEASMRDDLAIYDVSVKKQGPLSFYSIATLSDASVAQCRAGHAADGAENARKAHGAAVKAFGPKTALAAGTALPEANCLIVLGKLDEASQLLRDIDTRPVVELTGDPDWGAGVTLARAEIAARQGDYREAQKDLDLIRPVFMKPDAEEYQKRRVEALTTLARSHLQ